MLRPVSRDEAGRLADGSGRIVDIRALHRPIVVLCVSPSDLPALGAELLSILHRGSTVIDLGNTDPQVTDSLARRAGAEGVAYFGVGLACGPEVAATHCSLTIGEPYPGAAEAIDHLVESISGAGGLHAVVGPPCSGHLAKVLFNPTGYVCTYAVTGACTRLLRSGISASMAADILEHWCDEGQDSYLARVAIACLRHSKFEQEMAAAESGVLGHSGVAIQWLRLMADCGQLPLATAAVVSSRLGSDAYVGRAATAPSRLLSPDSARALYERVFRTGILELSSTVARVAERRQLSTFERCLQVWNRASLLSGHIYTEVTQGPGLPGETATTADLSGALETSRGMVALVRRQFGGHTISSEDEGNGR